MYREDELMKALQKAKKGSKDYYEDLCTMLFDEVKRLVVLVYEKESNVNKLVNHIFNKLKSNLNEFNPEEEDIHRWVSVFAAKTIYEVYKMSNYDAFTYKEQNDDFQIDHIEEDADFADAAIYFNNSICDGTVARSNSVFSMLTKGQVVLYELFCYAGCTVEEMEELLEVDVVYILSELCDIRNIIISEYKSFMGLGALPGEKNVEEISQDVSVNAKSDDAQDAVNDLYETEDYDDDDETEDDIRDNAYVSYLSGKDRNKEDEKPGYVMFENVSDKMLKVIMLSVVAVILVVVLIMVIVFVGKDNNQKPANSGNHGTRPVETQINTEGGESKNESSFNQTETQSKVNETTNKEDTTKDSATKETESSKKPEETKENVTKPGNNESQTSSKEETTSNPTEAETESTEPESTQPDESQTQAPETESSEAAPTEPESTQPEESQTQAPETDASESESSEREGSGSTASETGE